eukprot:sb/3469723/
MVRPLTMLLIPLSDNKELGSEPEQLHLSDHFKEAGLSFYNNGWYGIYDFSPVQHALNYSFLPSTTQISQHISEDAIGSISTDSVRVCFSSTPYVPVTHGVEHAVLGGASALFTIFKGKSGTDEQVGEVLTTLHNSGCQLRRCKETKMNTDTINRIYGQDTKPEFARAAKEGMVIGFEVEGDIGKLRSSLSSATPAELLVLLSPESSSDGDVNKFFNYVDMTM